MTQKIIQNIGICSVLIIITACGGSSSSSTDEENLPPTVSAGEQQTVVAGEQVNLQAQATDSDGSITSIIWLQTSGTSVELSTYTSLETSFTAPEVSATEPLNFSITVTDNRNAIATDTITILVEPNTCQLDISQLNNCKLQ